jgi:formylglycine-generating enzyme required for sulfatase activity
VSSALAPGSYLLRITAAGRPPVRYPVVVEGGAPVAIDVDVPARVPDGYIYVPAGRFLYGSTGDERERVTFGAQPIHPLDTGNFLIARTEVTFGDWIAFLEAQPAVDRKPLLPRGGDESGLIELAPAGRGWRLRIRPDTGDGELVATDDQPLVYANRDRRKSVDWRRMPVSGISWNDGLAYAAWLDRTGRLPGARPCNEREWERAARGADERRFPGGELREPDDANIDETYGKQDGAYGLDEVGSHPASDSPFGVADMVGNVAEWTRSEKSSQFFAHGALARAVQSSDDVVLRSASYYRDRLSNLLIGRNFSTATIRNHQIGARMCADSPPLEP